MVFEVILCFYYRYFIDVSKPTMRFTIKIKSFVRDGLHLNHEHRDYTVSENDLRITYTDCAYS